MKQGRSFLFPLKFHLPLFSLVFLSLSLSLSLSLKSSHFHSLSFSLFIHLLSLSLFTFFILHFWPVLWSLPVVQSFISLSLSLSFSLSPWKVSCTLHTRTGDLCSWKESEMDRQERDFLESRVREWRDKREREREREEKSKREESRHQIATDIYSSSSYVRVNRDLK